MSPIDNNLNVLPTTMFEASEETDATEALSEEPGAVFESRPSYRSAIPDEATSLVSGLQESARRSVAPRAHSLPPAFENISLGNHSEQHSTIAQATVALGEEALRNPNADLDLQATWGAFFDMQDASDKTSNEYRKTCIEAFKQLNALSRRVVARVDKNCDRVETSVKQAMQSFERSVEMTRMHINLESPFADLENQLAQAGLKAVRAVKEISSDRINDRRMRSTYRD